MQITPINAGQSCAFKQNNLVKKQEIKTLLSMTPDAKNQLRQRNIKILDEIIMHIQLRMSIFGGFRKYDSPAYSTWLEKLNEAKATLAELKAGKDMRIVEIMEPRENNYGFVRYDL